MTDFNFSDKHKLIQELENNFWEGWKNFGYGEGCKLNQDGEILWVENSIPTLPYNVVLKFQAEKDIDQKIDALIDSYRSREVQFLWMVHPTASPKNLPERLLDRGLFDIELMPGMVRSLVDLPEIPSAPNDIDVRKVDSDEDLLPYYDFLSSRWGISKEYDDQLKATIEPFRIGKPNSNFHLFQAWRDGEPVSKAGMYITSTSAGIYGVATKPEARRFGLGKIVTLTALHYAKSIGIKIGLLHSTPMAKSLYQSIGFELVANFRLFSSIDTHV